ncbi:MAG: hypothetical protein H0U92_06825 [Actinobacteria bacterium]|nr:hypothetical protein [Actinomycetota bacterium]
MVASRRYPGVYWTHNDSGGKPEVFALAIDGTNLGSYAFPGATAVDWEDVGIGPKSGADGSFIYAADIGDNAAELPAGVLGAARPFVTVYRAPEPALAPKAPGVALTGVEHFNLNYPNGREDAEALFVDPISGDLVIVTKSPIGRSRILTAPAASMVDGANITMVDHGTIQIVPTAAASSFRGTFVTGADISLDGSLILVRTYQAVLAFAPARRIRRHGATPRVVQCAAGLGTAGRGNRDRYGHVALRHDQRGNLLPDQRLLDRCTTVDRDYHDYRDCTAASVCRRQDPRSRRKRRNARAVARGRGRSGSSRGSAQTASLDEARLATHARGTTRIRPRDDGAAQRGIGCDRGRSRRLIDKAKLSKTANDTSAPTSPTMPAAVHPWTTAKRNAINVIAARARTVSQ